MLKIFLIFTSVVLVQSATVKTYARVASGVDAKVNEAIDYVVLSIVFVNQWQRCGGSLIAPKYVLTSATCLFDPVEGIANVVNVTSPRSQYVLSSNLNIYLHPNYTADSHKNDIAIIKLNTSIALDKSTNVSILDTNAAPDAYENTILKACGMGSINNYPRYAPRLQCTDLAVVKAKSCSELSNIICTQWSDRDNNLCPGDFGGPIYVLDYNGTTIPRYIVVGIAGYSPDYRINAPCLGGQKISHVQVGAYSSWINERIST